MKKDCNRLAVFDEAIAEGEEHAEFLEDIIERIGGFIALKMNELHGDDFRVVIDHKVKLVMVRLA